MYKDDLWFTKFTRAVEAHKSQFTDKQVAKYQIDFMLRLAQRVKDYSDRSDTCRGFQHTLTRLEEEMRELPESKAQRDYQKKMLKQMSEYFVKHFRLAPPKYYTRKWVKYGLIVGAVLGLLLDIFIVNPLPFFPLGAAAGLVFGLTYGGAEDSQVKQQGRLI